MKPTAATNSGDEVRRDAEDRELGDGAELDDPAEQAEQRRGGRRTPG